MAHMIRLPKNIMKTRTIKLSLLSALMTTLIMLPAQRMTAQTFTNLYSFSEAAYDASLGTSTNSDGYSPFTGVIISGNVLYGAALDGGTNGNGTLFSFNPSGGNFATLHTFAAEQEDGQYLNGIHISTNRDGSEPLGSLVLASGILYGAAQSGGTNGTGTVFAMNTNGTGFTILHTFAAEAANSGFIITNADGIYPNGALLLLGNTLYGTTVSGGTNGYGTIFSLTTNGTAFTVLHAFNSTNGRNIQGGLIASGLNILYGSAANGGTNDSGLVFAINTNGTGYADLYSFAVQEYDFDNNANTNRDGLSPNGGLALLGNTLFGTAQSGGTNGVGTIFAVNTNGAGFTSLYTFSGGTDDSDSPGALGLSSSGSILYGTGGGGAYSEGTVFSINTNGTGFTILYSMNDSDIYPDGFGPGGGVVLAGNTLYGANINGGAGSSGSIFALTLGAAAPATPPGLTIRQAGTNILVMWPTNFAGYRLEFTTNLTPPLWYTNLP